MCVATRDETSVDLGCSSLALRLPALLPPSASSSASTFFFFLLATADTAPTRTKPILS